MKKNIAKEKTLSSFRQIDDNIWTLVYENDYGLDELLEKGVGNIMDAVLFLQKKVSRAHCHHGNHGKHQARNRGVGI